MARHGLRWTDWAGDGFERAAVRIDADGVTVDSALVSPADGPAYAVTYYLRCDGAWRVRDARIRLIGAERRSLILHSDGEGRWTDAAGQPLPQVDGCIDIDITATPLTNTLPIRRLRLQPGQAAVVRVAYVLVPELGLEVSEQRYTCLAATRYLFELTDGDFSREIEVDGDGFVSRYPGLFRRLP